MLNPNRTHAYHCHMQLKDRAVILAAAIAGVKRAGLNPHPHSGFLYNERQQIRRDFGRGTTPSRDPFPPAERKANMLAAVCHRLARLPVFHSYRVRPEITPTTGLFACSLDNGSLYSKTIRIALPFKTALLYQKHPELLNCHPFLPYELQDMREVEVVSGLPSAELYKTKAVMFPNSKQLRGSNPSQPRDMRTLYILKTKDFTSFGVSRSGVISGAKTRMTNKLVRALGE